MKFCKECGSKLSEKLVGAENYTAMDWEGGNCYPYSKFDSITGKRQFIYEYVCPNLRGWFSNHSKIQDNEIILK